MLEPVRAREELEAVHSFALRGELHESLDGGEAAADLPGEISGSGLTRDLDP